MPNTRDDAVEIAVDDQCIAGTLVTPGTLIPGVLFVHGWGGSQQQFVARAREVAALGCICLTFDLRGHARTASQQKTVTREETFPSSSREEIAYILVLHTVFPNGFTATVRGVFTYRVNDEGLITNLRGYWNMDAMKFGQEDAS